MPTDRPLIRPSGTFFHKGRRQWNRGVAVGNPSPLVGEGGAKRRMRGRSVGTIVGTACFLTWQLATPAGAETIANPIAAFSGLDKITGRITKFDVYVDETVQFGALQITPRACYTHPPDEAQRTSVFVEVDQVSLQQTVRRIFTGWMFADSPALN